MKKKLMSLLGKTDYNCIGFVGKMQSGKTACATIVKKSPYMQNVKIKNFAGKLKKECASFVNDDKIDKNAVYNFSEEEDGTKTIEKTQSTKEFSDIYNCVAECRNAYKNISDFKNVSDFKKNFKGRISGRAILQYIGEQRRKEDTNYWIKRIGNISGCIVDDVRFLNESEFIKENKGILIRVKNLRFKNISHHESEVEQDRIRVDYTVVWDGFDIEQLKKQLKIILD